MILSDSEKAFLHSLTIARMQQHYEKNRQRHQEAQGELQKRYVKIEPILLRLNEEEVRAIRGFQDYSFALSAENEIEYYQCGVLDGMRLAHMIHKF